jgi:hypothetical protein
VSTLWMPPGPWTPYPGAHMPLGKRVAGSCVSHSAHRANESPQPGLKYNTGERQERMLNWPPRENDCPPSGES